MSAGVRPSGVSRWLPAICCWGIAVTAPRLGSPTSAGAAGTSWCGSTIGPCRCCDIKGEPFRLVKELRGLSVGQVREWPTVVRHDGCDYLGRLVVVKRDRWSAALERRALRKRASKKQKKLSRTALFLAGYFFVWTDVSVETLEATTVLAWYRCRWQIELYFKRMKSILGLGELPKRREDSCRAWLHGKLLVALLLDRLLEEGRAFFPLGLRVGSRDAVAGVKSTSCTANW